MPCVELKKGEKMVRVYFDKEKDRCKYEEFIAPDLNLHESYNKRRRHAYMLRGDKTALKCYETAYGKGKWFGEYSPKQIREFYKHAI